MLLIYTNLKSFKDLIRCGAHIGACNKKGQTPLDVCQPQARKAIIGLISSLLHTTSRILRGNLKVLEGKDGFELISNLSNYSLRLRQYTSKERF